MDLQHVLKRFALLVVVIVMRTQRSSIRADDDDDLGGNILGFVMGPPVVVPNADSSEEVLIGDGDSSEEVVGSRMSSAAAMFSSLGRAPRQADPTGCFYNKDGICASDGNIYNNSCEIFMKGLTFLEQNNPLCEWCKYGKMEPCPKKTPVCAGTEEDGFHIFDDKCHLFRERCHTARRFQYMPIRDIGQRLALANIGSCQEEVDASTLTCYEILRGSCPRGTMDHRVCNTTEGANGQGKTYKNICRVLHKRCKYSRDFCFDFDNHCDQFDRTRGGQAQARDCSTYILDFDVGTSARKCYAKAEGASLECRCLSLPPALLKFPRAFKNEMMRYT